MLHSSTFTLGEGRREECRISRRGSLLASSYYASPDYISLCVSRERCIILFLFILESSPVNFQFVKLFSSFREK